MVTRQRIVTFGIPTLAVGTIVTAALLHGRVTPPEPEPPTGNGMTPVTTIPSYSTTRHQVDVVFAVDTTASMQGLLDGAKHTVWAIASHMRSTDQNADIRIGLVAYRDVGDEYVTKPFALTNDLDAVYAELSSYIAAGGSDPPEDVDAAMDVVVHKMEWRPSATKLVFVVGDAPPHHRHELTAEQLAQEAAGRGIVVNTIHCNNPQVPGTEDSFRTIASLGKGRFSQVAADGGVRQIATPYDDQLAQLQGQMNDTVVIMGDDNARAAYGASMHAGAAAPAATKADRAGYWAKSAGADGAAMRADDMVGGVASGTVDLDAVEEGKMPTEWRGRNKDEVRVEIQRKMTERKDLIQKIQTLSKQREDYLRTQATKEGGTGGFDAEVKATVEAEME